ncbi:MAG: SGNH/GDSL hydrolase family protein [Clostridia bacterium]|nr:SGNH/GDSL hydrolase family protein [Clostridia bacterium]
MFLGSSVTYGSASGGWSMADYIAEEFDCTVVKWAVSGTTLVTSNQNSYVQRMENQMRRQKVCDHLIVQLSTNDASQNKPLGTISNSMNKEDFDTTTIIGAIEYIIATAKEKWNCEVSFYTGTKYDSTAYYNMVNALLDIQEKWGIGVIDLYNDPEMNAVSDRDYSRYMSDPIHPTKVGYKLWWGPKFAEHLQQYQ